MYVHANAKLAGRFALIKAIEEGLSLARDGAPLVAPLARGGRGGSPDAVVFA
jgi:hypothetical protein